MDQQAGTKQKIAAFAVAIVLLAIFGYLGRPDPAPTQTQEQRPPAAAPPQTENANFIVQISGEVIHPGLYEVEEGTRVVQLVELAGGFTEDAAQDRVNQAAKLRDGDLVVVPKVGEPAQARSQSTTGTGSSSPSSSPPPIVRISTADLEQLQTLPGVGPVIASNIVRYREQYGAFEHKRELLAVEGVTAALFERIEHLIEP